MRVQGYVLGTKLTFSTIYKIIPVKPSQVTWESRIAVIWYVGGKIPQTFQGEEVHILNIFLSILCENDIKLVGSFLPMLAIQLYYFTVGRSKRVITSV